MRKPRMNYGMVGNLTLETTIVALHLYLQYTIFKSRH